MPAKTTTPITPGNPGAQDAEQQLGAARVGMADLQDSASDLRERAGEAAGRAKAQLNDRADEARRWASDRIDDATSRASGAVDQSVRYVSDLTERGSAKVEYHRSRAERFIAENPALVGVVGIAAGLMLGALLPRTAREDRTVGPYADEARDQGLRLARDAVHTGRAYVEATLEQAGESLGQGRAQGADDATVDGPAGLRRGPSGRYQNH